MMRAGGEGGLCQQQVRRLLMANAYVDKHPAKQIRDSTLPLRVPPPVDLITDIGLVIIDKPTDIWVRGRQKKHEWSAE
jgi:hypothetical protein